MEEMELVVANEAVLTDDSVSINKVSMTLDVELDIKISKLQEGHDIFRFNYLDHEFLVGIENDVLRIDFVGTHIERNLELNQDTLIRICYSNGELFFK